MRAASLARAARRTTWSPDGRTVAYRDAHRGYNVGDEIYTIDADGSRARNLTKTPSNE